MGKKYQNKVKVIDGSQRLYLKNVPELLQKVDISNPQCILWYSGQYGLTVRSRDFYEKNFITPMNILFNEKTYSIWLYDLFAWRGFYDPSVSLKNSICKSVYSAIAQYERCVGKSSNEFFLALHKANSAEKDFVINILETRQFVWDGSEKFKPRGISCYNIDLPSWLGGKFLRKDTMEMYSALQYIEGLWLAREIVQEAMSNKLNNNLVNIVFLLPGDDEPEASYYIAKNNPNEVFASDIKLLVQCSDNLRIKEIDVNIYFYGFNYCPPIEICGILKLKRSHCPWVFFHGDELVPDKTAVIEIELDNPPEREELMDPIFIKKIDPYE